MIKVGNTYRLFRVKQYMSRKGTPYVRASLMWLTKGSRLLAREHW